MPHSARRRLLAVAAGSSALALTASGFAFGAAPPSSSSSSDQQTGHECLSAVAPGAATSYRQRVFVAAAKTYRVPLSVLLGVSYLESRWDNHGASPSTSGGYGPMNLTDVTVGAESAKGDGSLISTNGPSSLHTLNQAASLTQLAKQTLKSSTAANICGGAALLASYQQRQGGTTGTATSVPSWYAAVRTYSGSLGTQDADVFAQEVFSQIKSGEARVTNDGQRLWLRAQPSLVVPRIQQQTTAAARSHIDCPRTLACEWVPAPYVWYGKPDPYAYGNHDLANRPHDMKIDYIVIHDTEGSYDSALQLVQDPTYLAWNYTIRSSDGHVAQHLDAKNVGWHAGNWYVNMHSIGIEHEGFAAQGATWYTEAMYENSARLVRYLAHEYNIPLDRGHIIGHDQVPGITPDLVQGMHWDPGPYWDWQHYMQLLGAPLRPAAHPTPNVVTVAPGFNRNRQIVTDCNGPNTGLCPTQGTNFVYVHTAPRQSSPLVKDIGLHPDGSYSTTDVADIGARVDAGQRLVIAARAPHGWLGVWYLGQLGWIHNSPAAVVPAHGQTVSAAPGRTTVPVYGRAYPEQSAYPAKIPYQTVTPLQYTIVSGQRYVLADGSIPTDYYYAQTFNNAVPKDHTVVIGHDKYYEIWFGHRMAYVRAADVVVR
ncbi:MAG: N-acetylmuramoyl-L-alanine amidase [Nocardioidaceae bacterium]